MSILRRKSVLTLISIISILIYINWFINIKSLKRSSIIQKDENVKLYRLVETYSDENEHQQHDQFEENHFVNDNNRKSKQTDDFSHPSQFIVLAPKDVNNNGDDQQATKEIKKLDKLNETELFNVFQIIYSHKAYLIDINKLKILKQISNTFHSPLDLIMYNFTHIFELSDYLKLDKNDSREFFFSFGIGLYAFENFHKVC